MKPLTFRIIANNSCTFPLPSGDPRPWNKAEYRKEIKEKATKAGYNRVTDYLDDRNKKNPVYLESAGRLYRECVAKHDAESRKCEYLKKYWLECKRAQNA